MFGTILAIVVAALHLYVFWRASTVVPVRRMIPPRRLAILGAAMWSVFLAGRFFRHETGPLARALELVAMNWMGTLFLCAVCLLAVDILTLWGFFLRRFVSRLRGLGLAAGLLLAAAALVQGMRPPVVTSYDVQLCGLPREADGKVIVVLSDLHLGAILDDQWLEARVTEVMRQEPDIVVLLGDIFEGHGAPDSGLQTALGRLRAPLGIFAVLGNHEFYGSNRERIASLSENGIVVLRNEWTEVVPGLVIAGVDDLTIGRRKGVDVDSMRQALDARPAGVTMLLSHTPWHTEHAANAGVGLMLCGHTHGGQIWPFDHLVWFFYPFLQGRYRVGKMALIVSRGAGTWGPRMRLWERGEIVRVTLHTPKGGCS